MVQSRLRRPEKAGPGVNRWEQPLLAVGYALLVAAGAKGVSLIGEGMMASMAWVGAWIMFMLGVAYAAVRVRPRTGVAFLVGLGIGTFIVFFFAGMQMLT